MKIKQILESVRNNNITNKDVIIEELKKRQAEEYISYTQYKIQAKIIKGKFAEAIASEFKEHAEDEEEHYWLLVKRIIELGGTPLTKLEDMILYADCKEEDLFVDSKKALIQQRDGESCAIERYFNTLQLAEENNDLVTQELVKKIIADETEHESDLDQLLENF